MTDSPPRLEVEMARKKQPPPPPPVPTPASMMGLLSSKQVAIGLGNIGRTTLRTLIRRGEFPEPDVRIGCLPRWSVRLFNAWVEERIAAHEDKRISEP